MASMIPQAAHDLLRDKPTGHLALLLSDGTPSVNPVAVMFDGEHVRISTTRDRAKYRRMIADPRVAISIPHRNNPNLYIEIRGTVAIEDDVDRAFIDSIARHYMDCDTYPFDPPGTQRVVVTIHPTRVRMPEIPLANDPPARGEIPS